MIDLEVLRRTIVNLSLPDSETATRPLLLVVSLSLLVAASLHALWRHAKRKKSSPESQLPPGPRGFPFLGVLPRMGKTPHLTVEEWREQYGDVVCARMGSRLCIILNSADAVKECFVRQPQAFATRPDNYFKKVVKNTGNIKRIARFIL